MRGCGRSSSGCTRPARSTSGTVRGCATPTRSPADRCCRPWGRTLRSCRKASRASLTARPTARSSSASKGRERRPSTASRSNGARRTCSWCRRGSAIRTTPRRSRCCFRSPTGPRRRRSASGARGIEPLVIARRASRAEAISASSPCGRDCFASLAMTIHFIHDAPSQRVVFGAGSIECVADEAARLGVAHALVIATPGSGARLGVRVVDLLGARAAGLHAEAVIHVPRAVAEAGLAAATNAKADGLVAVGGGSAIGLAKIIARDLALPILALPTTYSGSEATPIWGTSEGERKTTGRDLKVLPRVIVYDPELTLGLPPAVTAASAMNAIAHCVEGLWVPERTPVTMAYATEAMRRFGEHLPRAVADGSDRDARSECLAAAWLAGAVLMLGTGLHHKLAHVLGGFGLPHAETHAIILPHVARFNLAAAPEARARLATALGSGDPAAELLAMVQGFPIPRRLRDVGFDPAKIDDAATQVAGLGIKQPRPVSAEDAKAILRA